MTLDIKAIARQSGGDYDTDESDPMSLVMFYQNELAEFVRLVRESVLEEAAAQCLQLADCEENTDGYRNGAAWCAERIKGLI